MVTENETEDLYPVIGKLSITMKNEERETTKQGGYLQLNKQKDCFKKWVLIREFGELSFKLSARKRKQNFLILLELHNFKF